MLQIFIYFLPAVAYCYAGIVTHFRLCLKWKKFTFSLFTTTIHPVLLLGLH